MKLLGILAVVGSFFGAGNAMALESVHVGVLGHNVQLLDSKNAGKEDGPAIEAQVNFGAPGFLDWALSPQPYLQAGLNLSGDTSFAAAGLEWRFPIAGGWSVEPGIGYAIHDGETSNPFRSGTAEAAAFSSRHVQLGSRDLFRTSLGVSRAFGERWSGQLVYVHYSHGQVLGNGRNQGMDQVGLRVGRRFGR